MKWIELTLEEAAKANAFVPATLHYNEDKMVYLVPDESQPSYTKEQVIEIAGKAWDAASKFEEETYLYCEHGSKIQAPNKETYLNSLPL